MIPALAGAIALGATGAAASPAALLDPPACTAAQMAGTRDGIPLMVQDPADEEFPEAAALASIVVGRRYAVVIDETLATRESTATEGSSVPVSGTIHVTAPPGLTLTPGTKDFTDYYAFKAPGPGPLGIVATWQQEVSSVGSRTNVICSASATLDVKVLATKLVAVRARFYEGYRFEVKVLTQSPADPRPVTALLRVRRGVAKVPAASGRVAAKVTFNPLHMGVPTVAYRASLKLHFGAESVNGGASVQVDPDGNFPRGTQLRFGFSLELRQGGKRVGGMRSGVICNRVQFNGYSQPRCSHPGFAPRP
ncbi:MAG: hypothetical protein QOE36_3669 [Gaiellaceae bacterium]|nr:hypothetical protein [Gaiellaceae bacterium]